MVRWIVVLTLVLFSLPAGAQSFDQIKIENAKLKRENAALKKQMEELRASKKCIAEKPKPNPNAGKMPEVKGWRSLTWGMSRKKVSRKYKLKKGTSPNYFYAPKKLKVGGMGALFGATFVQDKLSYVQLRMTKSHFNKNLYIEDYDRLVAMLTKKYGKPKSETLWSDPAFKNEPSRWGLVLGIGHVAFVSTWKLENTEITLQLSGDNNKVSHVLMYKSVAMTKAQEAANEKERLKDL